MEQSTTYISDNNKNILTEKQIELVNEARKQIKENPSEYIDWEDARKTLKVG